MVTKPKGPEVQEYDEPQIGRPTGYKPEFVEQVRHLCKLSATDPEIAEFFGVSVMTLYRWRGKYPEFSEALRTGKEGADERVEKALFQRAMGYSYQNEQVKVVKGQVVRALTKVHVPPDTTACIFWLKNRQRDRWRDVQKHEHGRPGEFDNLTPEELRQSILADAEGLGIQDEATQIAAGAGKPRSARRIN